MKLQPALLVTALLLGLGAIAPAQAEPQLLWPKGAPDNNGLEGPEKGGGCIGNVSIPTITLYPAPADKATGAAVVVIPGGGYGVVCVKGEGEAIAELLNARGITAVVLKYRLPNKHHEIPANDARRAIRTVRANAEAWGVDPKRVGVWGFSAGGHLASTVATAFDAGDPKSEDPIARQSSRPDFAILFYPVISMDKEIAHMGSRRNLMGEEDLVKRYSSELQVTDQTPPCFVLHCNDDRTVPVANATRFHQALVEHKVPAKLVLFDKGGHGPNAFNKNPSWAAVFDEWLKERGCMK